MTRWHPFLALLVRMFAVLLGVALLLNAVGGLVVSGFDASVWLVDLRALPTGVGVALCVAWGVCFLVLAWRGAEVSRVARWGVLGFGLVAIVNAVNYYRLVAEGVITTDVPVPMSLLLAAAAGFVLLGATRWTQPHPTRRQWALACMAAPAMVGAFLLAQILAFGATDYRRRADAIVVFGARVYADGRPSLAAADRVATGVELYHAGLAPVLLISGGPGDGETTEAEGMKRLAISLGVPAGAILIDDAGLNTASTVRNAGTLLPRSRVLAVSHGYHLARVKLMCERAGLRAYTVPAAESRMLSRKPMFVAREVVALARYYFRVG